MLARKITNILMISITALVMNGCGSDTKGDVLPTVAPTRPQIVVQETTPAPTPAETSAPEIVTSATQPQTTEEVTTEEETTTGIPMLTFPTPSEVTYINGILVVNKTYGLPADYNPGENPEARAAFDRMAAAAREAGLNIYIASGFRSYDHQTRTYSRYVYYDGQENADTYSARPGYSEHQTGLAFDMNSVDDSFAGTPEALWVNEHCHEYGFIIRYPKGKEEITGYQYEPWHVRYLGVDTATDVYNSGLTLEEYLGIDSKYQE